MKAVIQRVSKANVFVDDVSVGSIGRGMLILLGIAESDTVEKVNKMADKVAGLRIFSDSEDKINASLKDVGGEILVVSQFTLLAETKKGNRPSFIGAARPEKARDYYNRFVAALTGHDIIVKTGQFQAMMQVELVNDGPVTIILEV